MFGKLILVGLFITGLFLVFWFLYIVKQFIEAMGNVL